MKPHSRSEAPVRRVITQNNLSLGMSSALLPGSWESYSAKNLVYLAKGTATLGWFCFKMSNLCQIPCTIGDFSSEGGVFSEDKNGHLWNWTWKVLFHHLPNHLFSRFYRVLMGSMWVFRAVESIGKPWSTCRAWDTKFSTCKSAARLKKHWGITNTHGGFNQQRFGFKATEIGVITKKNWWLHQRENDRFYVQSTKKNDGEHGFSLRQQQQTKLAMLTGKKWEKEWEDPN